MKYFFSFLWFVILFIQCEMNTDKNQDKTMTEKTENPLLVEKFNTPYESIPFSKIEPGHFKSAIELAMKEAKDEIERIKNNPQEATFENTVEALDYAGLRLQILSRLLSNLNSAETNEAIQQVAQEIFPRLSEFNNEIKQDEKLFERVRYVKEHVDMSRLTEEQKTLLDRTYKSFVRSGALLSPEQKEEFKKIDKRLSELSLKFSKNLLHDTNEYTLHITDRKDLKGLPENVVKAAEEEARKRDKQGWIFTLQYPSYGPFMKYAENRQLREKLYKLYMTRGFHGDEYDNVPVILEMVELRRKKAELLGYDSYADFVLEERMAETPDRVISFLDELESYVHPVGEKELQALKTMAGSDGIEKFMPWDKAYYSEKLKQKKLDLDEEKLKPYFLLEKVVDGLFKTVHKLYGLQFVRTDNIDVYHPDVQVYEVRDEDGSFLALLYMDFFPREGKRQGAWMTSFKTQYKKDGKDHRPHISLVMNFTKPTDNTPSLLSFYEVTTLFHEFGHALHGMLSDVTYPSLAGTNVYWDFVELPSQIMENWVYEKEVLDMFAQHYETGEKLPVEYLEKIKQTKQFLEGMATLRQLGFGYLDMAWHYTYPGKINDAEAYEVQAMKKTRLLPHVPNTMMSPGFGHLFAGGYAAGYYSYKWAELLDAHAFSIFRKNGIFDKETARKFRHLLEQGGTRHPMELYKEFAGTEPDIKPLLRRAGFIQ